MKSLLTHTHLFGALLVLLLLNSFRTLHAAEDQKTPETTETWSGTAEITFSGSSTLHDWSGKVSAEPFKTQLFLANDKPSRIKSKVSIKASKMDTDEPKRDENMRKAMKAADHPLIIGSIDADFGTVSPAGNPTRLPMTITLLGKDQVVTATISNWKQSGDRASFDLDFPVSMKASGISVPPVLLFIRVGDAVKVHASVVLTKN